MNISIIAVGSELLLGQIANTNGQYLSKLFNSIGKSVVEHTVVGDNPERLVHAISQGLTRFDTIVLTGGLGPTKDDLTKQVVADILGRQLVIDDVALNFIQDYFNAQGQTMTPNNKQQALVIEGSTVLANDYGMAPGMLITEGNKKIVLLPGPPREMRPMAKNKLLPYLLDGEHIIFSEQLRFAGIGESKVETLLMDLIDAQENPTIAPLAGTDEVYIRLTANADTKEECHDLIAPVKDEILARIGEYYYGSDDILIEEAVSQKLTDSYAIYDGVTNGALYHRLKDVDEKQKLVGMLPDSEIFLSNTSNIHDKLQQAALYIKETYHSKMGSALLNEDEKVYICLLTDQAFKAKMFKMPQTRNILRRRSQNYALITLLNWLR